MNAIGLIELTSIAIGFQAADAMLKAADVQLLMNRTICPGKYIVMVGGEVAAVRSAVDAGLAIADESVVDDFVIPNIHPSIFGAISGTITIEHVEALGILETFSIASLIEAADAAVKAAEVKLIDVHLAMAIGGKAYFTLTGDVAAVRAAVEAGAEYIRSKGLIVNKVIIPHPRLEITQDRI
jgi:microcompartment protein CcmL/EutN